MDEPIKRTRNRVTYETEQFLFRLDKKLFDSLKAFAHENDKKMSQVIRAAIKEYIGYEEESTKSTETDS